MAEALDKNNVRSLLMYLQQKNQRETHESLFILVGMGTVTTSKRVGA